MDHNMPCQRIFGGICPECDKLQIMNKIDLEAIINSIKMPVTGRALNDRLDNDRVNIIAIKNCMKEAIHQALQLTGNKLGSQISELSKQSFEGWTKDEICGYKTSSITMAGFVQKLVMDVEKLIV